MLPGTSCCCRCHPASPTESRSARSAIHGFEGLLKDLCCASRLRERMGGYFLPSLLSGAKLGLLLSGCSWVWGQAVECRPGQRPPSPQGGGAAWQAATAGEAMHGGLHSAGPRGLLLCL